MAGWELLCCASSVCLVLCVDNDPTGIESSSRFDPDKHYVHVLYWLGLGGIERRDVATPHTCALSIALSHIRSSHANAPLTPALVQTCPH